MANRRITSFVSEQKIVILILAVAIALSLISPYFLRFKNLINVLSFVSVEGIIAIGMAFLVIVGEIDLSVGSVMALSGILAILFQRYGVAAGILAGLLGGTIVGLINGLIVTKLKIASIAATLGMMVMVSGVVFALTEAQSVKGSNPDFMLISQFKLLSIPGYVIIFVLLAIIFQILLKLTVFGRNVYAVGGNVIASRLFGIKVDRVRITCFVITGFLAGLAGVVLASKINVASGRIGINTALLVITAVLLGGISLAGGEGSVFKAVSGFLLIGILNNAMVLLQVSAFIQDMVRGLILIIIVILGGIYIERSKYG